MFDQASELLIRTIELRGDLPDADRRLLENLNWRHADFASGSDIVVQRSSPKQSCLILSGIAGRAHLLENGGRQISNIHFPGDFVDLHAFVLRQLDHSITPLTACRIAQVDHDALRRISDTSPHLSRQLWMLTAVDAAIERVWLACLGRRSSEGHLAHFICETYRRLQIVDLARDLAFDLPLTQAQMADIMGLSVVHVNRTLQRLRGDDLIEWTRQEVVIKNWHGLVALAGFDTAYLNLEDDHVTTPS